MSQIICHSLALRNAFLAFLFIFVPAPVYSEDGVKTIEEYHAKIISEKKVIQDIALERYITEIIGRLNEGRPDDIPPLTLTLIDEPVPNAFTIGSGYIYVYTGLLGIMQTEAELAMVLGHELAHGDLNHATQGHIQGAVAAAVGAAVGARLANRAPGPISSAIAGRLGGQAGAAGGAAMFDRMQERSADLAGFRYLAAAGYNTAAGAQAFQRLADVSGGVSPGLWLRTHPLSQERLIVLGVLARRTPGGDRVGEEEYKQYVLSRFTSAKDTNAAEATD